MVRVINATILAAIMIESPICIPYSAHSTTPALNWNSVIRLTSFTDLVFLIFIIWGTNPKVVRSAAAIPMIIHSIS